MYKLKTLQELVNNEIENQVFFKEPNELYEPVSYILSMGGKRMRPVLLLMATNLFSDEIEDSLNQAVAIEMFHNFTLLHDDIMDNALVRRNRPTVHVRWNSNVAILSGDVMSILANKYITQCKPELIKPILDIFNDTAIQVCEGQQYDMNFENRIDVSVDEYMEMIKLKTSVLVAVSLKIGALTGGANETDAELLYDFGLNIGLAFQLQDDLLDVYGDRGMFGKKIGGDILANKKTYLLINALDLAKGRTLQNLKKQINSSPKTEKEETKKISNITNIYDQLCIRGVTELKIREFFEHALLSLNKVSIEDKRKNELREFADKLITREN